MLNLASFPVLATERLFLRELQMEDEKEIFELRSNEQVNEFIERQRATSADDARNFIHFIHNCIRNNESLYWGIQLKEHPSLIGTICLWNFSSDGRKAEVGYELLPFFWKKGIMQEAFAKVVQYGFDNLKLSIIEAWTLSKNLNSIKFLQRNGFKVKPFIEGQNENGYVGYEMSTIQEHR